MNPDRRFVLWLSWVCQILAALVLAQSLYFKFTGAPEAVWIFSQLGVESWGRYVVAILELWAVLMLLIPQVASLGALLGILVSSGAILSHLFVLGITLHPPSMPEGDDGSLFGMAIIVWVCCLVVLWLRRAQLVGMRPGTESQGPNQPR